MTPTAVTTDVPRQPPRVAPWLTLLLATAIGMTVANIYYAQPIAGPISRALGISPAATGLIVTMTQIGYGLGLLLVVPLGDLFENRRLVMVLLGVSAVSLLGAALSTQPLQFLIAALLIGTGTVAAQVLVPYAAHMAPEAERGKMVGNVTSGLMIGIMLARPTASFVTQISNWHRIFFLSAGAMVVLTLVLGKILPKRVPTSPMRYGELLASMAKLAISTKVLQRRALYQAALFAAFSIFWTTTPLLLAGPVFRLSQGGIALFALVGVSGALAAPLAGRLADRGLSRATTGAALLAGSCSFLLTHIATPGSTLSLGFLVGAAVLLDFAIASNLTLSQRALFALGDHSRARLNGLFMTFFFMGGAIGSALGGWAFARGGWELASWLGFLLPIAGLLYYATEWMPTRPSTLSLD